MRPYLLIFVAALLWSLLGILTAVLLEAGLGAMEIAFWPALIGGACFVVHESIVGGFELNRRVDIPVFGIFGLIGVTLFFAAFNFTVETGGVSLAVILLYTAPGWVVVGARLFLGEPITAEKVGAVALVIGGVTLISATGAGAGVDISAVSVGWGLTAGLAYALVWVLGKHMLEQYRPSTIHAYILPVGAVGLLPFVEFGAKTGRTWAMLAVMGVLCTYVAYQLYYLGLRRAQASRAVLVASTEPVAAAVLAALLFGERLGLWGVVGAVLVLAASWLGVFWKSGGQS